MKQVIKFIENKKQEFADLPLFEFMRDKSIDPRQRLSWASYAAPFIMNFGEMNKYVFRDEPTSDPIQAIINKHSYEDDHHWLWFLEDFKHLGIDQSLKLSEALRFLWGEETEISRWLVYQLYKYILQADSLQKLIVIEVIEATGNVMFSVAADIGKEMKAITQKEFLYFANFHLNVETGHTTGSPGIEEFIQEIQLTEKTRQEAFEIVEQVFDVFTKFTHELLVHAKKSKIEQVKY
ncbi:MAG: hypothetical protein KME59_15010 [Trichormus sp. ATA11-4-KO1]|jgi:hypothetical protein|nr:hypothetical protein [Trichormus sp. ATA11-4-KO1]